MSEQADIDKTQPSFIWFQCDVFEFLLFIPRPDEKWGI